MKLLVVADSVSPRSSSGRVVHKIYKVFSERGVAIQLLNIGTTDKDTKLPVKYLPKKSLADRKFHQINKGQNVADIIAYIESIKPDVVHFASFNYGISRFIIAYLRTAGIKTILQPWTYEFFCARGFAFRDGQICTLCVEGNTFNAVKYKCNDNSSLKSIPSAVQRSLLRSDALDGDVFVSSCGYIDDILEQYGVDAKKIKRLPVPFDNTILHQYLGNGTKVEEDYFIFYGQAKDLKGFYLIAELAKKCPGISFKLCPIGTFDESVFAGITNIEMITNVSAGNGLFEMVKNAKAVLLPSIWPTTTEYTLYEAMYFEKAIVAFNVGAHIDLLTHGVNALVSTPGDIDDFVNNIELLNEDPSLRQKLGLNAKTFVDELADDEKFYNQLNTIYNA